MYVRDVKNERGFGDAVFIIIIYIFFNLVSQLDFDEILHSSVIRIYNISRLTFFVV